MSTLLETSQWTQLAFPLNAEHHPHDFKPPTAPQSSHAMVWKSRSHLALTLSHYQEYNFSLWEMPGNEASGWKMRKCYCPPSAEARSAQPVVCLSVSNLFQLDDVLHPTLPNRLLPLATWSVIQCESTVIVKYSLHLPREWRATLALSTVNIDMPNN